MITENYSPRLEGRSGLPWSSENLRVIPEELLNHRPGLGACFLSVFFIMQIEGHFFMDWLLSFTKTEMSKFSLHLCSKQYLNRS